MVNLETNITTINNIIDDLRLINEDISFFLTNAEKQTSERINEIIKEIIEGDLNIYETQYKTECEELITKYRKKAEERKKKKESSFFNNIYDKNKKLIKDDEVKCIQDTEECSDKLINIFNQGIKSLDTDLLDICLNTIKQRERDEIEKEINILIKIFGDEIKEGYNKEEIIECLILLSRKEDIYNIAVAILIFIERTEAQKGEFTDVVNEIISKLEGEKSNDDEIIKDAINKLKKYGVDVELYFDKTFKGDNYLNMLIKLKEQPEAIKFLLTKSIDYCRNLQELVGEMDDGFLNTNDILGLEKCVEFINRIGDEQTIKKKKDIEAITSFKKEVKQYEKIEVYFYKYIDNYSEIQNLVVYRLDKSEASKQKILFILKKSKFTLRNTKENPFEGQYHDESTDKGKKKRRRKKKKR